MTLIHRLPLALAAILVITPGLTGCDSETALGETSTAETVVDPVPEAIAEPAPCLECGVVASIRELRRKGDATGIGAATGAVVGGVIGSKAGKKDVVTVVGVIGGGVAGHEIEKRVRSETYYEIEVRMESGETRVLHAEALDGLTAGSKVRVVGDHVRIDDRA